MLRDRSRISKVAIVKDGAAMLPKTFVEMALGLSNVLTAPFFFFFLQQGKQFERSTVLNEQAQFTSKRTSGGNECIPLILRRTCKLTLLPLYNQPGQGGGLVGPVPRPVNVFVKLEYDDLATERERQLTTARKLNKWLDNLA